MQALRLATEQEPKIAKSVGEMYLNAFVNRGWLAKSSCVGFKPLAKHIADESRGRFNIAPRGMVELEPYLTKEYSDRIKKCHRCRKMLLTVSPSCSGKA
jgi:hypothetical protein